MRHHQEQERTTHITRGLEHHYVSTNLPTYSNYHLAFGGKAGAAEALTGRLIPCTHHSPKYQPLVVEQETTRGRTSYNTHESHSRPIGCPQMTWGRTLENALKSKGISKDFDEWIAIAKDRSKWRQLTHSIPKPPDA